MRKYITSWRANMLSNQNPLLQEGVFDIGLPPFFAEEINKRFEEVSPKAKTILAKQFKGASTTLMFDHNMKERIEAKLYILRRTFIDGLRNTMNEVSLDWSSDHDLLTKWSQIVLNFTSMIGFNDKGMDWSDSPTVNKIEKAVKFAEKSLTKGAISSYIEQSDSAKKMRDGLVEEIPELKLDIYDDIAGAMQRQWWSINDWLKTHPESWKDLASYIKNYERDPEAFFWHLRMYTDRLVREAEKDDQILHNFDDGNYWYDLETSSCDIEGRRMGHCGGDDRAETVFSLRKKPEKKKESSSYVTVAYNASEDLIYQIKGRQNKAPDKEYWPHIAWLIGHLGNPKVVEIGEHSNDVENIKVMIQWLDENTDAEYTGFEKQESPIDVLQRELEEIEEEYDSSRSRLNSSIIYDLEIPDGDEEIEAIDLEFKYTGWVRFGIPFDFLPPKFTDRIEHLYSGYSEYTPEDLNFDDIQPVLDDFQNMTNGAFYNQMVGLPRISATSSQIYFLIYVQPDPLYEDKYTEGHHSGEFSTFAEYMEKISYHSEDGGKYYKKFLLALKKGGYIKPRDVKEPMTERKMGDKIHKNWVKNIKNFTLGE